MGMRDMLGLMLLYHNLGIAEALNVQCVFVWWIGVGIAFFGEGLWIVEKKKSSDPEQATGYLLLMLLAAVIAIILSLFYYSRGDISMADALLIIFVGTIIAGISKPKLDRMRNRL
jgi:uncharacterized membrane protein